MRWKKRTLAVAAAGALVAAAACGGDGSDSDGPGGTFQEGGGTGSGMQEREAPAPEVEGAVEGGTIRVLSNSGLNTMMPPEQYYTNTGAIGNLLHRSLTQYTYDEESGDMILVPDLATDLGTANEDNTEWTFTLRDGVKWENGEDVTAEDIATGIKMSMDRATFPQGPDFSNKFFLHGGCDPEDEEVYEGYFTTGPDYDGVVVDGNEITIKMACPFPDMPYWGSFAAIGPMPEDINPAEYARNFLSTGPYKVEEYTPEKSMTLVRNEHWDPATDPGRNAYPDRWEFDFDVDTTKIDEIILQDSEPEQATITYDDLQAGTYLRMQEEAPDRVVAGPSGCNWYLAPDYRKIREIEVRQALGYAFPTKAYLNALGQTIGVNALPATANIMPPGTPGREEFSVLDRSAEEADPEKAKELLAEAGYKPGEYEVTWLYSSDDPESTDAKDQVVKGFEEAGFKVNPVATTTEAFSDDRQDHTNNLNLRLAGWCFDWPTGGSWFPPLFETTNLEAEGLGANYAVFSEPEIDKEIKRINELPVGDEQNAAWQELDEKIQNEYFPVSPIYYTGEIMGHGSKIRGMEVDSTKGMPTFTRMWVQQ